MKRYLLLALCVTSNIMNTFANYTSPEFLKFNNRAINLPGKPLKFSIKHLALTDCSAATAIDEGTTAGPFDNTGIVPAGSYSFVPPYTAPNVFYFELNATDFAGGENRLKVTINGLVPDPIANESVFLMTDCNGMYNASPTPLEIDNNCVAVTPLSGVDKYYIAVVTEAGADAGLFSITLDLDVANTLVPIAIAGSDVCEGDPLTLTATNDPDYTYVWSWPVASSATDPGDNNVFNVNATADPTDAGTYTVTVTDAVSGCTNEDQINIAVNPLPVVTLSIAESSGIANNDGAICVGDAFTLTANPVSAIGYDWDRDATPVGGTSNIYSIAAAVLADDGIYTAAYTDANGCQGSDTYTVVVNVGPTTNDTELKVCANGVGTGDFTLTDAALPPGFPATNSNDGADIDNGAGGVTITYHATLANAQNGVAAIGPLYTAADNTIVYARIEDNATACFSTAEVTLSVNSNPTVAIENTNNGNSPADFDVCVNDDIDLNADVTTALAPYTYVWDLPGAPNQTVNPIAIADAIIAAHNGQWFVTVTDANGCTGTDEIQVTVNPLPVVSITIAETSGVANNDGTVCVNDAFTLNANPVNAVGYVWQRGVTIVGGTSNVLSIASAVVADAGTYTATYTDANGCVGFDTYDVIVNTLPNTSNTELKECANIAGTGDFTLTDAELPPGFPATNSNATADIDNGAAGVTVTYHTSLANAQNGVAPIGPNFTAANNTTIFARIENNATACYATATVLLTVNSLPNNIEIQNTNNGNSPANFTICAGSPINLNGSVSTGQAPYTFLWDLPGAPNSNVNPIAIANATVAAHNGLWQVTVTDANGCTDTDDITITVTANPVNDLCSNSLPVNLGNNNGLTNLCATQDLTPCTAPENEASVWYDYDIPTGVQSLTITSSSTDHAIAIFQNNCSTLISAECDASIILNCPAAQTIKIMVSSATVDAGTFNLTLTQVNTTAANDLCTNAESIPDNPICVFFAAPVSTTVGACPEIFTVSGCAIDNAVEATVWYTFTTPPGTTSIELDNITANTYLHIFNSCPAGASTIAGGGCLSGGPHGPITVTANTQYWVAIAKDGVPGNVGFSIKYNVLPLNDNPCLGSFVATPLAGTLANQDNTCATMDRQCGGNTIEKTLWYTVTLTAPNDKITINVTGLTSPSIGLFGSGNPCAAASIQEECNSDGEAEFVCLQPGTYHIMVGTSIANAGVFDITFTQSQNGTVANDVCTNAIPIVVSQLCTVLGPFNATNIDACPENIPGQGAPCDFNAEETSWYSFVAPGMAGDMPTMDFEFTAYSGSGTPFMRLFEGSDCAALTSIDACKSGLNIVFGNIGPLTPGNTYLIALSSLGDVGGNFTFEVKFNIGPPNDDPCANLDAYDLTGTGSYNNTTDCAGGDPTMSGCPVGDQQNVVFYKFTIGPGVTGIHIVITPNGANPFSGGIVAGVATDACNATGLIEVDCGSGSLDHRFECLAQGDYFLQVSTSSATAGDFNISYTPILNSGPANDLCSGAIAVPLVACAYVGVAGTTVNACPETTNAGGCTHAADPTVFYTITTPAGATQLDFDNISANTYITIFNDCTLANYVSCSEDTNPFENITIAPNTTYILAVSSSNPDGEPFTFDIRVIVPPVNDCLPEQVPTEGAATFTNTCCSTYQNDPGACPPANQESTVWFEYTPGAGTKAILANFSSGSMSGFIAVEVFLGAPGQDCTGGFTPVSTAPPYCIGTGSQTFEISCADFVNNHVYVKVGTSEMGCGTFSLSFTEPKNCTGAETCADITEILNPVTDGAAICLESCNNYNCSEGGDCDPAGSSVWFQVHPELTASAMIIQIQGNTFTPIVTVYSGLDCGSIGSVLSCEQSSILTLGVNSAQDVFIKVEAQNGNNLGPFELCVSTLFATFDCYESQTVTTRPDYPNAPPAGPYCPGETVNFCHSIQFTVAGPPPPAGNSCQWIQGIIPTFGDGWDLVTTPISTQGPAGWFWLDENNVDYNFNSSQYELYTTTTGQLGLRYDIGGGNLSAGTLLPGGWWFTSNGGGGCSNDGDPDTMWGLPGPGCSNIQNINFCFDLKVKELPDLMPSCDAADLGYTIFAFADGETGCWTNLSCALSVPYVFSGDIDCSSLITLTGMDHEICSDSDVLIQVAPNETGVEINLTTIDNPNVTGETLTGTWDNIASFTDHLINTGPNIEVVTYVFRARKDNSICEGPPFEVNVTVYPQLQVEFPPTYVCTGACTDISPTVSGGSGNYVSYIWNPFANSSTITVCPMEEQEYSVTVTDSEGCTGTGSVLVEVKPPVEGAIDPETLAICQDGVEEAGPFFVLELTSGSPPYIFNWNAPVGFNGVPYFTNFPDDSYDIEEESSLSSPFPIDVCVFVYDLFNCENQFCAQATIDGSPDVTFTHTPVACGQTSTVLTANYDFGSSSSSLEKFELYDCEDNLLATKNNDPSTFNIPSGNIPDLNGNNCFKLITYTENGCTRVDNLVVPIPQGTQALLTGNSPICRGLNSTLEITNAAAYNSFTWSVAGVNTPTIIVSPDSNTIYTVTVTEANGCSDVASFEVIVSPEPGLSLIGSLSFCPGTNTTIQAVSEAGNTIVWTDAGNVVIPSVNGIVNISIAGNYNINVSTANNCQVDSTIAVISSTSLQVSLNDLTLCDGMSDTLNAGIFFDTYQWKKDGVNLAGETGPKLAVNAGGVYCVDVTKSGCAGSGCKTIVNNTSPVANITMTPVEVCRVNSGVGPTFIDFTSLVTGAPGSWQDIELSGVDLSDLSNVSFLGILRDTFTFRYITNSAIVPCLDDSLYVDVIVNNCPCPTIAFKPIVLCNDESNDINLNEFLSVNELIRAGVWTITSGDGSVAIINDSLANITDATGGIYNLSWTTNSNFGSCPKSDVHFMTLNDAPQADIKGNRFICNANSIIGPSVIDLDTVLIAGTDLGIWTQISGSPVSGLPVINGIGMSPGLLEFEYSTNSAIVPCTDETVLLRIDVRDCSCPFANIKSDTLCNGSDVVNLNTLLEIIPLGTPGTWTSNAPGAVVGSNFTATGIPAGSYTVNFNITNPGPGCQGTFSQDIVLRRQPVAERLTDGSACNNDTGNGITTVNLTNLLKPGASSGGVWTQISGSPTLAIVSNDIDLVGLNIGDVFEFRYDVTASPPCTPVSATVKVTVKDCNCPNVNILPPADICNNELSFDLTTLQDPDIAPGVWTVQNSANLNIPVNNGSITINGLAAGNYDLTYTLNPAPSGNCDKFSRVNLKVIEDKKAVIRDSFQVCTTNKGNNENIIDFRTFILSGSGSGVWENTDNAPVNFADHTNVDFKDAVIGTSYTFTFRLNNDAPCPDHVYTVEVEVIDCKCDPINPRDPASVCTSNNTINLTTYNDPVLAGNWISTQIPIVNNVADISALNSGNYTITYVITNPEPGCPDREDKVLTVIKAKNVGTPSSIDLCSNEPELVILWNLLTGEDIGGQWREISNKPSTNNAFNPITGSFNTNNQAASSYQFEYGFFNQAPCPDVKTVVTVNVISAPTAQAGNPATLSCTVADATLGDPTDNQVNVTYAWSHESGNPVVGGDKATVKVNYGGKFTIVVRDTITGCTTFDDVIISVDPNKPTAQVSLKNVSCFNAKDGNLSFINIQGGIAPLQYSKDGGLTFQASPIFNNLSGGNYTLLIKDAAGCTFIEPTSITEPENFVLNIGPDVTITLGDSVNATIDGQILAGAKDIKWTTTDTAGVNILCQQPIQECLTVEYSPLISSTLCVMAVDQNDCEAEDCKVINLLKARNVVFPNVLQTDNNGENKTFYVESSSVGWINKMRIYDRWGNLMFSRDDFAANDPNLGWNGKINGKEVVPGVYTWLIELEYDAKGSGEFEVFSGDVTVIK